MLLAETVAFAAAAVLVSSFSDITSVELPATGVVLGIMFATL